MNAVCVRCGRHRTFRLERGEHAKGLLCHCGGMIVKARIVDLFEFPTQYEPVNLKARAKLAESLARRCVGGATPCPTTLVGENP